MLFNIPSETLIDILACLRRQNLDDLLIVNRQLCNLVEQHSAMKVPKYAKIMLLKHEKGQNQAQIKSSKGIPVHFWRQLQADVKIM